MENETGRLAIREPARFVSSRSPLATKAQVTPKSGAAEPTEAAAADAAQSSESSAEPAAESAKTAATQAANTAT